MVPLGDEAQVQAYFCPFGGSAMQDRCVKRTMGSEIILDPPDELLGDVGLVECHLFLFGDSVSVDAR
jgi:hypothetical protein